MNKHIEQTVLKAVIPMEIYSTSLAIKEKANHNGTKSPSHLSEHLLSGSQQDG